MSEQNKFRIEDPERHYHAGVEYSVLVAKLNNIRGRFKDALRSLDELEDDIRRGRFQNYLGAAPYDQTDPD